MFGRAALGGDHRVRAVVLDPHQRHLPDLAALLAARGEQHHRQTRVAEGVGFAAVRRLVAGDLVTHPLLRARFVFSGQRHRGQPRTAASQLRIGPAQQRQQTSEVTALADPVDLLPADPARCVEDEGAAKRTSGLIIENPVRLGDLAVRPMIGQQIEADPLRIGVRTKREHRITGDRNDPHPKITKLFMIIAQCGQLAPADPGERPGIEDDHRPITAQIRQADLLAVLIAGDEVRRRLPDGRCHRRVPLGRTSLVAAQSAEMDALVVCASPAVTAASAMSAAST